MKKITLWQGQCLYIVFLFLTALTAAKSQSYCTTNLYSSGCSFGDDIDNFSFANINQTATGCPSGNAGYSAFLSDTIKVNQGLQYTLSISSNYSGQFFAIWIDTNNDGDFNDPGEFIWASTTGSSSSTPSLFSEQITIPLTTPTGVFRFRIRGHWNSAIPSTGSCTNFSYGETHDYTIQVSPAPSCLPPSNITAQSVTSNSVTLNWSGNATAYNVEYGIGNFTPGTGTVINNVTPPYTVTGLQPSTTYKFNVQAICTSGNSPWSSGPNVTTLCVPFALPYAPSFATWPPVCFAVNQGQQPWTHYSSDSSARANFWSYVSGTTFQMTTGSVDITSNAWLRYRWSHQYMSSYPDDRLIVMAKATTSTTWDTLKIHQGPSFNSPNAGTVAPGNYIEEILLLDSAKFTGKVVEFRFLAISGFGPDLFLKNIIVEQVPACPFPTGVTVTNITDTSALVTWVAVGGSSFNISWGAPGTVPGTTVATSTSTSYLITGLQPTTNYQVVVQNNCSNNNNGLSSWSSPVSFRTKCAPFNVVYQENFDNMTTGQSPECWSMASKGGFGPTFTVEAGQSWQTTQPFSTPNHLVINQSFADTLLIITPRFADLGQGGKQIRARFASSTNNSKITVVRVQQEGSFTGLTVVDSITGLTNSYQEKIIYFNDTVSTTRYIGFMITGAAFNTFFIDNFNYENVPACVPSINPTVTALGPTSATITLGSAGQGISRRYEYGTVGFLPGVGLSLGTGTFTGLSFTITGLTPNTSYEVYVRDSCPNAVSPWIGPLALTTPCGAVAMPTTETFTTWPPQCYTFSSNGNFNWQHDATAGMAVAQFWSYNAGNVARMNTPYVVMNVPAQLKFKWSHEYNATWPDTLVVLARKLSGASDTLLMLQGPAFNTPGATTFAPAATLSQNIIPLPASFTGDTARIEFHARSGWGPYLFIDDVTIEALPACPDPMNITLVSNTATSATLNWTQLGSNASSWDIEWGPVGFTPGSALGNLVNVTTKPATITGLPAGSCIDIYVRAKCASVQDSSAFKGPVNVCLPYEHDIELLNIIGLNAQQCGMTSHQITAIVKNNGFVTASNIPFVINITGDITQTINYTYPGPMTFNKVDTIVLGSFNSANGGNIQATIYSNLAVDQKKGNDTLKRTSVLIPLAPKADSAFVCQGVDTITLKAKNIPGVGYNWFATATATTPVGTGNTFFVPSVSAQNTYYLGYASQADSLLTTTAGGNAQNGNMFNVVVKVPTVTITAFTVSPQTTGLYTFEIYYKSGTHVGFENTASAWTLLQTFSNINVLQAGPTVKLTMNTPITLPQGTHAFYITTTGGVNVNYTNGTAVGSILASNAQFDVLQGVGKAYPFGSTFQPRNWNGYIHFGTSGCSNIRTPVTVGVALPPTANFTYTTTNYTVNFSANVTNADSVHWTFGTAGSSSQLNPTFTFPQNGVYPVCLKAFNNCGSATKCDTLKFSIGINESLLAETLKLYPNPNNGVFELTFSDDLDKLPVRIYDIKGVKIFEQTLTSANGQFSHTFDLSRLPKGVYMLKVNTSAGDLARRLVIQ
ncbi:MAG: fibronectin type III domain-containing protein [Thermaurantimonas sp.]|uniref:fibronectin type III domain-containing protein n=1 Tax=Thermaurantimonas sp. TaxID=2681568 RepID=UPI00391DF25A